MTHPDDDYMGSTIAAHEKTTNSRGFAPLASPQDTTDDATGIDVSHYQGTVNWSGAVAAGASFAYAKATEGVTFTDPQFTANYTGANNAGLLRGAYHFGLPDVSSGAAQANYFLANGGGWVADGKTMPPVLDIEYDPYPLANGTSDPCYGLSATQMLAWINDFATTVYNHTDRWPMIYSTTQWWTECTGNSTAAATDQPLWIARAATAVGTLPAGWSDYTIWQNGSGTTSYATGAVDSDIFNGTTAQLAAFALGSGTDQITAHYAALGGSSSYLGAASGAEYPIAGGWAQNYAGGVIYYAAATGAWAVHGLILSHYQQLGGPGGVLGFPTTDENGTPDGVGRYNHFAGAGGSSIYFTPNTGAHEIQGAIQAKWASLGWERSALGYPTTDESGTPDGIGRYNHFAGTGGSSIYFTPSTGAHAIQGAIQAKWAALGWEAGPLGYPTTDETGTPDGVGRFNHFSKDGSIYWTPSTGAWSVHGAIQDQWAALGWERGRLGYPTSDEFGITGGRRNNFQHGYINWFSANGATQVIYY